MRPFCIQVIWQSEQEGQRYAPRIIYFGRGMSGGEKGVIGNVNNSWQRQLANIEVEWCHFFFACLFCYNIEEEYSSKYFIFTYSAIFFEK